jgi:hypothetical protein
VTVCSTEVSVHGGMPHCIWIRRLLKLLRKIARMAILSVADDVLMLRN